MWLSSYEQWYEVVYQALGSYCKLMHDIGFSPQRSAKVCRHQPSEAALAQFEAQLEKK